MHFCGAHHSWASIGGELHSPNLASLDLGFDASCSHGHRHASPTPTSNPCSSALSHQPQVCLEYLERYYFLIAFAAYLGGPSFSPGTASHATFAEWWRQRPELRSILERMLRRNPLAALSLDKSPDALAAGEAGWMLFVCWAAPLPGWPAVACCCEQIDSQARENSPENLTSCACYAATTVQARRSRARRAQSRRRALRWWHSAREPCWVRTPF